MERSLRKSTRIALEADEGNRRERLSVLNQPRSLAWHLVMFGIALCVPVVIIAGISLWNLADTERHRIETEGLQMSRELSGDVDRKIDSLSEILQVVAVSSALEQGDFRAFKTELDAIGLRTGLSLLLRRGSGAPLIVAGGAMADPGALPNPAEIAKLKAASTPDSNRRPILSELRDGPSAAFSEQNGKFVTLRLPLWPARSASPDQDYEIELDIPVSVFRRVLLDNYDGNDLVSIIDGNNRILARTGDHELYVGRTATADLIANTTGVEGTWIGTALDGRRVFGAYVRGVRSGWRVAIGINRRQLGLPFQQSILLFVVISVVLVGLAVTLALLIGKRLTSAMKALTSSAAAVDRGEVTRFTETPVTEVNQVGAELANSSATLLRQTDALAANAARLKAIYETDPVGILVAEAPSGRIIEGNHATSTIFRYPIIQSKSVEDYDQWIAFHADGSRVESHEHPLFRVIKGAEDRPELECHALRGDGTKVWIKIIGAPIRDQSNTLTGALVAIVDIDDAKRAEDDQRLMNRELHHRVKNTLATVLAITNLTTRSTTNIASFRKSFADRILSLSRTHTLLIENSWSEIPLRELVEGELEPYIDHNSLQVSIEGEDLALPSDTALALGMAFHELTTNAVKYGALSQETGALTIAWTIEQAEAEDRLPGSGTVRLSWVERGGPAVAEPDNKGFGSQLLQQILARQLKGEVRMNFQPEGLEVHINVPH